MTRDARPATRAPSSASLAEQPHQQFLFRPEGSVIQSPQAQLRPRPPRTRVRHVAHALLYPLEAGGRLPPRGAGRRGELLHKSAPDEMV